MNKQFNISYGNDTRFCSNEEILQQTKHFQWKCYDFNAFFCRLALHWSQLIVILRQVASSGAAYCTNYRGVWFCSTISIITFQRWFCWFQSLHGLEGIGKVGVGGWAEGKARAYGCFLTL
jgi:hypothetical protein